VSRVRFERRATQYTSGQGTCRRFFFHNAYLEFVWVHDEQQAASECVRPLGFIERSQYQLTGASPFGLIFRPSSGITEPGSLNGIVGWPDSRSIGLMRYRIHLESPSRTGHHRLGDWLSASEARALWQSPNGETYTRPQIAMLTCQLVFYTPEIKPVTMTQEFCSSRSIREHGFRSSGIIRSIW
jgi:hypothetical protein